MAVTSRNQIYYPSSNGIASATPPQLTAETIDERLDRHRRESGSKWVHSMGMYEEKGANLPGHIVIMTDLNFDPSGGTDKMVRFDIKGMTYWPYNNIIDLTLNFYILNGTVYSAVIHNGGTMPFKEVRIMRSNGTNKNLCIALLPDTPAGANGAVWHYPKLVVDGWISWSTEVPDEKFRTVTITRDANVMNPQNTAFTHVYMMTEAQWWPLALVNNWSNYGYDGVNTYSPAQYRRIGNVVVVQGLVRNGTQHAHLGTLPSGFRPDGGMLIFDAHGDAGFGRVDVWPTGEIVQRGGGNGWFSLSKIIFPANGLP